MNTSKKHLNDLVGLCLDYNSLNIFEEAIKLKLFPFSIIGKTTT